MVRSHDASSFIFEPKGYALGNLFTDFESFDPPSTPAMEVRNHRGHKKGTSRALFVPFSATRTFLFSNEFSSSLIGGKDQRHHGGLRCMLSWRDCLCVNVQSRQQSGMPQQLLHHLEFGPDASQ
jgi:hypothetical protein